MEIVEIGWRCRQLLQVCFCLVLIFLILIREESIFDFLFFIFFGVSLWWLCKCPNFFHPSYITRTWINTYLRVRIEISRRMVDGCSIWKGKNRFSKLIQWAKQLRLINNRTSNRATHRVLSSVFQFLDFFSDSSTII